MRRSSSRVAVVLSGRSGLEDPVPTHSMCGTRNLCLACPGNRIFQTVLGGHIFDRRSLTQMPTNEFKRAWWIANVFRQAAAATQVAALNRKESRGPFGARPLAEWTRRLMRLNVEFNLLTAQDLPTILDEDPARLILDIRVLSEILFSQWQPWLADTGELDAESERWLSDLRTRMHELGVKLGHAIEAVSRARTLVAPDLPRTDREILGFLEGVSPNRAKTGDIAAKLGKNPKTIGKNLSGLVKRKLIDRSASRQGYRILPAGLGAI